MSTAAAPAGVFNDTQTEMIDSVFTFDDKTARDVMVPRQEVVMLDMDGADSSAVKRLLSTRLSRFPVYGYQRQHHRL